ncbi:hypothetical protein JCM33374_g6064 [Metschnikowia sp. JCM 33374]|nr:hypothetical protein JCM33374_g6064 [Metschnikowia sp. JCM 33374]
MSQEETKQIIFLNEQKDFHSRQAKPAPAGERALRANGQPFNQALKKLEGRKRPLKARRRLLKAEELKSPTIQPENLRQLPLNQLVPLKNWLCSPESLISRLLSESNGGIHFQQMVKWAGSHQQESIVLVHGSSEKIGPIKSATVQDAEIHT